MTKKYFAEHVRATAAYHLPADLSREIGRIIVHWAYFEAVVQEMNWQMLNLSAAAGRVALREPRVEDRLTMLHELLKLRKGEWDDALYKSILKRAKILATKRDLLAHGIWARPGGEWVVQLTRGSWPKNLAEIVSGSRKVLPESIPMDVTKLRSATSDINALIDDLKKLRASASGPPWPSPETRR